MAKVIFRQAAIHDLTAIWNYTAQEWSENQADKYYQTIKLACLQIGENPKAGKKYPEIDEYLSGLKVGKHIIFYRCISEEEIEVIRILHERMDLKNRISE